MRVSPYLNFNGTCREAFTFYHSVLGGTLDIMSFGDIPSDDPVPATMADRVMHARLGFDAYELLGSDTFGTPVTISGAYVSINPASSADVERIYAALSDGGEIEMELQATFWTKQFAMLSDRFGAHWIINGEPA